MKKARKVKRKIKRKYVRAELFLQILICLSGRTNFSLRAQVEAAKQKRTLNFDLHSKFRDPVLFLVETSLLVKESPKLNFLGVFNLCWWSFSVCLVCLLFSASSRFPKSETIFVTSTLFIWSSLLSSDQIQMHQQLFCSQCVLSLFCIHPAQL